MGCWQIQNPKAPIGHRCKNVAVSAMPDEIGQHQQPRLRNNRLKTN